MYVICRSTDSLRKTVQSPHDPTQVLMKTITPNRRNNRFAIFGGKNEMIEQTGMG